MLTRRSFLVGAGAGLVTPRLVDRFQNYLAVHGEPLMLAPKNVTHRLAQLDRPADYDQIEHQWTLSYPAARAFKLLHKLDLGSLVKQPGSIGGVDLIDEHYKSGGCYKAVHCADLLSVSLLQARLNELGTGLAVELS